MKKNPLVSVVITCYNYEKYVGESIESVLNQDYENIELIIINDGSTDGSDFVIRSYKKDNQLTYISRANKGIVATRNQALSIFKGDYLLQLDADDTIPQNYVSDLVRTALEDNAGLVYTDYLAFGAFQDASSFPEYNYEMLKNGNYIHISCLLSRGAITGRSFDENLSKMSHEDWDFFLGICSSGVRAVKCSTVKLNYRMHESSRNNQLSSFEDRIKYTEVYSYLIRKQEEMHPKDFYYLVGRLFADWYSELDTYRKDQSVTIQHLEAELNRILSSRRYKVADKIGNRVDKLTGAVNKTKRRFKSRYNRLSNLPRDVIISSIYKSELKKIPTTGLKKAIVLHLYYTEMWSYFSKKIETIMSSGEYDLFVNVPHRNAKSALIEQEIKKDYPNAIILFTPNQGRDVLSFMYLARYLDNMGYDYLLKMHSKKSPQRQDGKDWADEIINSLTASTPKKLEQIENAFTSGAAIIGPAGSYVPLTTYYNDNQPKVHWLLSEMFGKSIADDINANNFDYGFFAGTMFWMRLSTIRPILKLPLTPNNFPPESAQLDGTVAHAIERLLCVVPEYSKMDIYEVNSTIVKKIPHKTEFIPDWSDYHHAK